MKRLPAGIQVTLAVALLLSGAAAAATPGVAAIAPSGDLGGFQLVAPGGGGAGWALLGQQLFWTDDGGGQWRDITPPALGVASIRAASFSDPRHGWVVTTVLAATGSLNYALARTADGGQTWQAAPLALFAAIDAAGMAGEVYLQFIHPATGWLVVKQATSSNFN